MTDATKLDAHHRKTVEKLFSHPTSHNIQWHDVRSLLEAVAEVEEMHDGRFRVTRGGTTSTPNRSWTCAGCSRAPATARPDPGRRARVPGIAPYCWDEPRRMTPARRSWKAAGSKRSFIHRRDHRASST